MKGTRPLDNDEIRRVSACFTGTFEVRNRRLFMLGVSTGGRISELLSLRIGDVYQNGKAVSDLLFDRSIVKGEEVSKAVPVNVDGRAAIEDLIDWHQEKYTTIAPTRLLNTGKAEHSPHNAPIDRRNDLIFFCGYDIL